MPRCKDCMHYNVCAKEGRLTQIDEHIWDNFNQLDNVETFCENYISTADVVTKSEPLFFTEEEIAKSLEDAGIVVSDKSIGEIKAEVAREIFEEIEKVILDNTYPDFDSKHKPVNVWKATTGYDAFYELKKKYTEGKHD